MTRSLRQMLTAYHLLVGRPRACCGAILRAETGAQVFYVMVRMLGAGTSRWLFISLPGLLTRRLPNTHAICAAVLAGTVAVDELVHAFATASVNHTRSLVGNPCAKSAEPLQCCICHETDEDGEQLYDFCSVNLIDLPLARLMYVSTHAASACLAVGGAPGACHLHDQMVPVRTVGVLHLPRLSTAARHSAALAVRSGADLGGPAALLALRRSKDRRHRWCRCSVRRGAPGLDPATAEPTAGQGSGGQSSEIAFGGHARKAALTANIN